MSLQITNVQRFNLYDGPGIRTTIFLKGCSIQCPWCCNPENIQQEPEFYLKQEDCISCKECQKICPQKLIKKPEDIPKITETSCLECKKCVENCPTNAIGIYGETTTNKNLLNVIKKDKEYYQPNNGGVTFSGGEPLLKAPELVVILKELKNENIHVAVETSLFAPLKSLKKIENRVDLFIIDIKILNEEKCREIIKGNLKEFKMNIEELESQKKNLLFRFPLIKPLTFNKENINLLYNFIQEHNIKYLEIFKAHNLASNKYKSLGLKPEKYKEITEKELKNFKTNLENDLKIKIKILNI
jgi:pyruvate formate lyase activating enzyme